LSPVISIKRNFRKGYQEIKNLSSPQEANKKAQGADNGLSRESLSSPQKRQRTFNRINSNMGLKLSLVSIIPPFYGYEFLSFSYSDLKNFRFFNIVKQASKKNISF